MKQFTSKIDADKSIQEQINALKAYTNELDKVVNALNKLLVSAKKLPLKDISKVSNPLLKAKNEVDGIADDLELAIKYLK